MLEGMQFRKWVVVEQVKTVRYYNCQCKCGKIKLFSETDIKNKKYIQCKECLKPATNKTHGMSNTSIYIIWKTMIRRCHSPKTKDYRWYGARGITVDPKWKESFINFYKDMGDRPEGLQLDRINNDLGYFKENCRWVTRLQNSWNRRDS